MSTEVVKRLINVDEYYKMAEAGILKPGDRIELIHGEIYEMNPIGSRHAATVDRLARLLNQVFNYETIIRIQNPVRLSMNNEPVPDISILKYRADEYAFSHPEASDVLVIIEIADSSIKHDREIKKPLYAFYGIPEYWIIDIENIRIEVFTAHDRNTSTYLKKAVLKPGNEITLMSKTVQVKDLFPSNDPPQDPQRK